jgi:adenylate cyclase
VGIATGYATLGRIGFEGRHDYAAIGNVAILASRLSQVAGPGEILVSQRVHAAVESRVRTEPARQLELRGFSRPVVALQVVAIRD